MTGTGSSGDIGDKYNKCWGSHAMQAGYPNIC